MSTLRKIVTLYTDGFRSMNVGRSLWVMIVLKVTILFAVLKVFFFPDLLNTGYDTDEQRAQAVRTSLTMRAQGDTASISTPERQTISTDE